MASCATQIITAMVVGLVLFVSLLSILLMSGTPDVQCWRCNGKDCILAPGKYRTCIPSAGLYPSPDCGNGCAVAPVFTAPNIMWAQPNADVPIEPNVYCASIPGDCRTICAIKNGVKASDLDPSEFDICNGCDMCPRKMKVDGHDPEIVYVGRNRNANTDNGMSPMGPGPMSPSGPLGMGARYSR